MAVAGEPCEGLVSLGGLWLLAECPEPAGFEAEWICPRGHSRKRLSCVRHMEAVADHDIGCAQCLAAGVDGVPITFCGAVRLPAGDRR